MERFIDTFAEFGRRLEAFGACEASRAAIREACADNEWFTPGEIRAAVEAIRTRFLDREQLRRWMGDFGAAASGAVSDAPPAFGKLAPHSPVGLVVAAGNIPLVGFYDLLAVLATGARCRFKPSSKDAALVRYIVGLLRDIDPRVPVEIVGGDSTPPDFVIATGSDRAVRYFREAYAGIPALLRGSRYSVAVLDGSESAGELAALADDVFLYSGLGCRSVSRIFVPEGCPTDALVRALSAPREMNPKYLRNYLQQKALCAVTGRPFVDLGHAVLTEDGAPALSCVALVPYKNRCEVEEWIGEHRGEIQCVVGRGGAAFAPVTPFGAAQHPTLFDHPDGVDVRGFILLSASRRK